MDSRDVIVFTLFCTVTLVVAYAGIAFVTLDPYILDWPQELRCFMLVEGAFISPVVWTTFFDRWYK